MSTYIVNLSFLRCIGEEPRMEGANNLKMTPALPEMSAGYEPALILVRQLTR